jgi:hypothetical protein
VAGRTTERGKISDVPSRNTQTDCFEDRGPEIIIIIIIIIIS